MDKEKWVEVKLEKASSSVRYLTLCMWASSASSAIAQASAVARGMIPLDWRILDARVVQEPDA